MNSIEVNEIEEYRYAKSQESMAIPFYQAFQTIESWQMNIVMCVWLIIKTIRIRLRF
jgi:hypothetical protein